MIPIPMIFSGVGSEPVPYDFNSGDLISISFIATSTISVGSLFDITSAGLTWSGGSFPFITNAYITDYDGFQYYFLTGGTSTWYVNTEYSPTTIGQEYYFSIEVASGYMVNLAPGSNLTYLANTKPWIEKDNSYLSITYAANSTISGGEFACIQFTVLDTIQSSSVFNLQDATWTGQAYFYEVIEPYNSFILESSASPILINPWLVSLSPGDNLFTVSSIDNTPIINDVYWLVFKVADGCTVTLPPGTKTTFSSDLSYNETLKLDSYLAITY